MQLPSVSALVGRAADVLRKFPLTMLLAAVAAVCAVAAVDGPDETGLARIAMVAMLGVPLSIGLALLARYRGWGAARQALWQLAGIALLLLFYRSWPGPDEKPDMLRYLQLSAIVHLGVSFLPFIRGRETSAFWQYNRRLFESFLRAVLFSGVLFAGLAIALVAVDKLFGVHVPPISYPRLWLVMALFVHPWIFLSGVPEEPAELDAATYPRALKVFTQYVLTPLVAIYLAIVVLYGVKIIATGSWPSGWVGYLVTSVAVAGMLGFLLVHPLRVQPSEGWIRFYSRMLFLGLIPAAILLLLALWKRVDAYGLTELRVLGLVLGIWLLAMAVMFTTARETAIRTIPLSLAAILLVCFTGPISAARLGIRSQARRLEHLLAASATTPDRAREASAAVGYLIENRAVAPLRRIFGDSAISRTALMSLKWAARDSLASRLLAARGVLFDRSYARGGSKWSNAQRGHSRSVDVSGFDWMVPVSGAPDTLPVPVGADTLRLGVDSTRTRLAVSAASGSVATFFIDSMYLGAGAGPGGTARPEALVADRETGNLRFRLVLDNVYAYSSDADSLKLSGWNGELLIGRR